MERAARTLLNASYDRLHVLPARPCLMIWRFAVVASRADRDHGSTCALVNAASFGSLVTGPEIHVACKIRRTGTIYRVLSTLVECLHSCRSFRITSRFHPILTSFRAVATRAAARPISPPSFLASLTPLANTTCKLSSQNTSTRSAGPS